MPKIIKYCIVELLTLLIVALFFASSVNAQISDKISRIEIISAIEEQPIELIVEFSHASDIRSASFFYKNINDVEFRTIEMEIIGTSATIIIGKEFYEAPSIDYFISVTLENGSTENYPLGAPDNNLPLQIKIEPLSPKDEEIIILSPGLDETINQSDLLISFSLYNCSNGVAKDKIKVFLNDIDISNYLRIEGDLASVDGSELPVYIEPGRILFKIELFDINGNLYHTYRTVFNVAASTASSPPGGVFTHKANAQIESRNENYSGAGIWYNNFLGNMSASYDDWKFGLNLYITSEERNSEQPRNRYQLKAENSWLKLNIGDNYPQFPNLILNGKRVRGIEGELNFEFFNMKATFGQLRRQINGNLIETLKGDTVILAPDVISIDSLKYGAPLGRVEFGTESRNLFALRPAFNIGNSFYFGFSYMHSKDFIDAEFAKDPEENALIGADFNIKLDANRIQFRSEAVYSMYNSNIKSGTLTDRQIDSLFSSGSFFEYNPEDLKKIKNLIDGIITFNQFFQPLNPSGLSTLAGEAELKLNYFNNNFKLKYIYRGNGYKSFGQEFIRTDVEGFSIYDQFNFLNEGLFFNAGYERLHDNLQNTKSSTTLFQTLNGTISYFPTADLPSIIIGYTRYINKSDVPVADSISSYYTTDNSTDRIRLQVSHKFKYLAENNLSFSFSTSFKDDKSPFNFDGTSSLSSLSLISNWNDIFASVITGVIYSSKISGVEFNYSGFSLGGRISLMEQKLFVNAAISPSFGDLSRQSYELTAEYLLNTQTSLLLQSRLYKSAGRPADSIIGLILRVII